jgi:hypothetical protein
VRLQRHGSVWGQHSNPVAGADAKAEQRRGQAIDTGIEFGIREAAVSIHHGDGVAVGVCAAG